MIFTYMITALLALVSGIFSILPTVPPMPVAVTTAGVWVTDQITLVVGVLNMIYGQTLLAALMVVIIGMFTFDWIYHTAMWIIRKIPMINIH